MSHPSAAKPIAVQLYSLREAAAQDFDSVLRAVADIGYQGVEPAGFYHLTPAEFVARVTDLGMKVASSHTPWAALDNTSLVIDTISTLGLGRAAAGFGPDNFRDLDAIKQTAETVNTIIERLAPAGIELFLHNHFWEFDTLDGRIKHDYIRELCPAVKFEIDTYWAANFGAQDPAGMVRHFSDRAPLLHIKDGPLIRNQAMVAVGQGAMDIPAVIEAADPDVLEWLIVELDACDTDMLTAVRESYDYLSSLN